jgi:hypothetical protein
MKTWKPTYTITSEIARSLMEIEAAKAVIDATPISPAIESELRYKARLRSTYYSMKIAGSKLTMKEVEEIIKRKSQNKT